MAFLRMLRQRHLAVLWLSQVLSAIGDHLYAIAVIWIAVQVAGSSAGLIALAQSLAMLVFGMLGGVYADRWNRRTTMIAVDLLRAGAVLSLPILATLSILRFWHLLVVAVIVGTLSALFNPALQASFPALSGDTQTLQATNGLMDVTRRLARAVGPSLVGLLTIFLPVTQFFTLDAVSFGVSALALFSLGRRFAWQPERSAAAKGGIRDIAAEIGEALRLVARHRPLTWALANVTLGNFVWGLAFVVGVPLLAKNVLSDSIGAYGLIVGAYGVGNVASNLVIGSVTIRRRMPMLFSGRLVMGAGFLLLASAHALPLAMLGAGIAAISGPLGDILLLTMIQSDLPSGQIGKVYSLMIVVESGGASLGALVAVPLYAHLSVSLAIALCALLLLATGIAGLLRFGLREPTADSKASGEIVSSREISQ